MMHIKMNMIAILVMLQVADVWCKDNMYCLNIFICVCLFVCSVQCTESGGELTYKCEPVNGQPFELIYIFHGDYLNTVTFIQNGYDRGYCMSAGLCYSGCRDVDFQIRFPHVMALVIEEFNETIHSGLWKVVDEPPIQISNQVDLKHPYQGGGVLTTSKSVPVIGEPFVLTYTDTDTNNDDINVVFKQRGNRISRCHNRTCEAGVRDINVSRQSEHVITLQIKAFNESVHGGVWCVMDGNTQISNQVNLTVFSTGGVLTISEIVPVIGQPFAFTFTVADSNTLDTYHQIVIRQEELSGSRCYELLNNGLCNASQYRGNLKNITTSKLAITFEFDTFDEQTHNGVWYLMNGNTTISNQVEVHVSSLGAGDLSTSKSVPVIGEALELTYTNHNISNNDSFVAFIQNQYNIVSICEPLVYGGKCISNFPNITVRRNSQHVITLQIEAFNETEHDGLWYVKDDPLHKTSNVVNLKVSYPGWSDWQIKDVGTCSVTCGTGIHAVTEERTCTNPAPQHEDYTCIGVNRRTIFLECQTNISCPALDCYSIVNDTIVYTGNTNATFAGEKCQRWDVLFQQVHTHTADDFPDQSLTAAENFCRDPRHIGYLWCYTTHPPPIWNFCRVPLCPVSNDIIITTSYTPTATTSVAPSTTPSTTPRVTSSTTTSVMDNTTTSVMASATASVMTVTTTVTTPENTESQEHLKEVLQQIVQKLKVDKTKLSTTLRKKTSVPDERRSSTSIGYTVATFMCVPFVLMIIGDIPLIIRDLTNNVN